MRKRIVDFGWWMADGTQTVRPSAIRYPKSAIHSRGFTLIEAMLAGVLLALIGAAVGGAASQSLRTAIVSRDTQRAASLLDETMTRIDLIGPARLAQEGPTNGTFDPPDDRFQWSADIETLAQPDLYQVTLTVTWMGTDGQRSAQVVTRLYDPAGSRDAYLQWNMLGGGD